MRVQVGKLNVLIHAPHSVILRFHKRKPLSLPLFHKIWLSPNGSGPFNDTNSTCLRWVVDVAVDDVWPQAPGAAMGGRREDTAAGDHVAQQRGGGGGGRVNRACAARVPCSDGGGGRGGLVGAARVRGGARTSRRERWQPAPARVHDDHCPGCVLTCA